MNQIEKNNNNNTRKIRKKRKKNMTGESEIERSKAHTRRNGDTSRASKRAIDRDNDRSSVN